jgi:uncharacterized membrane protein YidH (DUF202 family)
MRRYISSPWTTPIALLLISLITYGVTLNRQGLYWDDWFLAYFIRHFGPSIFPEAFSIDRPLMGHIYQITTGILGDSLSRWQLASLITHWLAAVAFLFFLHSLWPRRNVQNSAAALLFLIYPGFQQQYIAITHTNDYIVLSLYLVSLATMVLAFRKPSFFWPLYLFSILSGGFVVFTIEYYFGLELLRPLLIWLAIDHTQFKKMSRLLRTAATWLPFAMIDGLFLLYRLTNDTPRGKITIFDRFQSNPLITIMEFGKTVLQDTWVTGFKVWTIGVKAIVSANGGALVWVKFIAVLAAGFAVSLLILYSQAIQNNLSARKHGLVLLMIGIFSLMVAGIPYWMTGFPIRLEFPFDRFTLPMMLGAALVVVGLVEAIVRSRHLKIFALSLVITTAVAFQYQNGQYYAQQWDLQKDFFWQLYWRMPGLQTKTILLTSDMPFAFDRDDSLSAPLDWTYAEDGASKNLSFIFYDVQNRFSDDLSKMKPGREIDGEYRIVNFSGNLDQSILIYYHPPDCLKVFDPERDKKPAEKPQNYSRLISFSKPERILLDPNPSMSLPIYLSPEPVHDWCYFYQRAELARQLKDWNKVVDLANQAIYDESNLKVRMMPELLPYIEGFAHTGQWGKAVYFTILANDKWGAMQPDLCSTWNIIVATLPASSEKTYSKVQVEQELHCGL